MRSISYWRNWTPNKEILEEHRKAEPTKLSKPDSVGSVSSHSGQSPIISSASGMALHDSTAWAEDFQRWAISQCVYKDRCFGGINSLLRHFCEWQVSRDEVPCSCKIFEVLLRDTGFFFADGFVYGLVLRGDMEAILGNGVEQVGQIEKERH